MATKDFLLEVGVEEIPDWMIEDGLAHLQAKIQDLIGPLNGSMTMAEATPRRLVIACSGLQEREADREEIQTGPPKQAPAPAVAGFAKKCGVTVEELEVIESAKGT